MYLKAVQTLNIQHQLPTVDPSHYINRFASLLEFGDDTRKVAEDAARLVQRFDRDWMRTGRRPSGICGACLLLAARMNNYRRSIQEIVQVVKIADTTVRKRLDEFGKTPSRKVTISDFRTVSLEGEADPPAFTKAKEKRRDRHKSAVISESEEEEEGEDAEEEEEGEGPIEEEPRRKSKRRRTEAPSANGSGQERGTLASVLSPQSNDALFLPSDNDEDDDATLLPSITGARNLDQDAADEFVDQSLTDEMTRILESADGVGSKPRSWLIFSPYFSKRSLRYIQIMVGQS